MTRTGAIKTNSKTNTAYDLKCADSLGLHFAVQYCGSCLNISKLDLARLAAIVSKREYRVRRRPFQVISYGVLQESTEVHVCLFLPFCVVK